MEKTTVTISWEGLKGPYGPQDIQKILETHYKNKFKVHRVNLEDVKAPEKLVYSVSEASQLLGISKAALYSLLYQKQIPGVQWGKRWLIPKVAIEKQLGGSVAEREKSLIDPVERADFLATADEVLKLYDLLRGKLTSLVKNLSKEAPGS